MATPAYGATLVVNGQAVGRVESWNGEKLMHPDEVAFQAAIHASPLDKLPRLVFCDWLDERSDPRAEGYRVLATFDRWPWMGSGGACAWYKFDDEIPLDRMHRESAERNHGVDRSSLPHLWEMLAGDYYETHAEAMDAAAEGWRKMPEEVRESCLAELARLLG